MTVFGGNWRNGFAIGLVVGICLTLIFCVWSLGTGQIVRTEAGAESPSQQTAGYADQQQDFLPWWEHDGVLVTSKDTLAQWAMALLGLIATGLSAWAVILLKRTLHQTSFAAEATRDAVTVTRELGHIQSRANVFIEDASVAVGQSHLAVRVGLRNGGHSHALGVKVKVTGTIIMKGVSPEHFGPFLEIVEVEEGDFEIGVIVPGEHIYTDPASWRGMVHQPYYEGLFQIPRPTSELSATTFIVFIDWLDIFGGIHKIVATVFCSKFKATSYQIGSGDAIAELRGFTGVATIKHQEFMHTSKS